MHRQGITEITERGGMLFTRHVPESCASRQAQVETRQRLRPRTQHNAWQPNMQPPVQRAASTPPTFYPSKETKQKRREEMHRTGHALHTWSPAAADSFCCTLPAGTEKQPPLGASLPIPGKILPLHFATSQSLFGPSPHRTGAPPRLRSIAAARPRNLPTFMVHDITSCTSSAHANFFKEPRYDLPLVDLLFAHTFEFFSTKL